jgi:hypothetical protein
MHSSRRVDSFNRPSPDLMAISHTEAVLIQSRIPG